MTDPSLLANYQQIPEKIIYNAKYAGIGNLTSAYKAPIFASQGHYTDIQEAAFMVSNVIDPKTGKQITYDPKVDETFVLVEKMTGTTLQAQQRLMINFMIEHDYLIDGVKPNQPWLLPYTYVRRDLKMTPA